mmetsp:Transcript_32319/g.31617  ORF Transcript_32319/g.31617 Transcript_32319/m.31617 type:complete len:109 (-) Transcript_32319:44-370(-)
MNNFMEDQDEQQAGIRECKGAFNVNCSTTKDPNTVMTEMIKALEKNQTIYKKMNNYGLKCQKGQTKFDMEVTRYDSSDFFYVVKFKKVQGQSGQYQEICQKILNNMSL